MSEVVVTLQLSVALQEKFENYAKPVGLFGLNWKTLRYPFLPQKETSVHTKDGARDDIKVQTTVLPLEKRIRQISDDIRLSNQGQPKLEYNLRPKLEYSLNSAPTWPAWLFAVSGDAIKDWTPRRVDSFEKLNKIAHGTYSNVYKARDLISGKIVVLKKVRVDTLDPKNVEFMAREILILKTLNHPNIIKLEGLITSKMSSSLYLVFEYIEHDLSGLGAGVKFTEPQIKCLIKQLLSRLEHCHKNGVLHRDIMSHPRE